MLFHDLSMTLMIQVSRILYRLNIVEFLGIGNIMIVSMMNYITQRDKDRFDTGIC